MSQVVEAKFLNELCESNRKYYSDERGKGVLRDLQQTFPHPWRYLAELVQNAVDEEARVIRIGSDGDSKLIFEHDGNAFTEENVQALCRRGVSTKGAGTLGFMGIGFKSVFHSFQRAEVASGRWRFYLEVRRPAGAYGQQAPDWVGCVLPRWDSSIQPPGDGMQCRFVLRDRLPRLDPVENDLGRLFSKELLILPLLARRGVKRVECDGHTWVLARAEEEKCGEGLLREVFEARDPQGEGMRRWVLFSAPYTPSREAVRQLLEHRQLDSAEKERFEAERQRCVKVFLPLDEAGVPVVPNRGQAFALLPTGVEFPIGLHVQADWLLATNREQIIGVSDSPWHQEICARIPPLLAAYLRWVSSLCEIPVERLPEVYSVLPDLAEARGEQAEWIGRPKFRNALTRELERLPFLPVRTSRGGSFVSPETGCVLPEPLRHFEEAELLPWALFGGDVASTRLLGDRARQCLDKLGLLREILPAELAGKWADGAVGKWQKKLGDRSQEALLRLLAALAKLDERQDWRAAPLCCLPSREGAWIHRGRAVGLPRNWDSVPPQNPELQAWLEPCLPPREQTLDWPFDRACQQHAEARKYLEGISRRTLEEIMPAWWDRLPERPSEQQVVQVLEVTSWVRAKMRNQPGLVTKGLCEAGSQLALAPLGSAVLADPYASRSRRRFFPGLAVVSGRYLRHDPAATDADWRSFFESLGPELLGPLRLERRTEVLSRQGLTELVPDYQVPETRATGMRLEYWGQELWSWSYLVADFLLPEELARVLGKGPDREAARDIGEWLREAGSGFRWEATWKLAYVPYGTSSVSTSSLPKPSSWVEALIERQWIFATDKTGPHWPSAVLPAPDPARPESPVADLPPELVQTLVECGIPFGSDISDVPHLERLRLEGPRAEPMRLRELIERAITEAGEDADRRDRIGEVFRTTDLFPVHGRASRVPIVRLVRRAPRGSDFGGWLIALDQLPEADPLPGLADLVRAIFEVPEAPTWDQACDFLESVWSTKQEADAVRRALPRAYEMVRDGIAGRTERRQRWDGSRRQAVVFTRSRNWILVEGGQVFLDDLEEQRLESYLTDIELATPGHLGETADERRQTAELLGLPLLSSRYGVETTPQDEQPTPAGWRERLNRICDYLQRLAKEEGEASVSTVTPVPRCCARLMKSLTGEGFKSIEWEVQAAFRDGEALVAGDPIDFMAELCPLLLAWAGLSGRRDMERLAPQVTQLIALLNRPEKFEQQVAEHYRQKGWEAPAAPAEPPPPPEPPTPTPPSDPTLTPQAPTGPGPVPPRVTPGSAPGPPGSRTPEDREAMLSAAWRRSVEARREYEQLLAAGPVPAEPGEEESAGKDDAGPSDEPYREAVMEYERDAGRHPVAKPREQPGHDIDSHSHPEGHPERKLVRRIEVKGKGRPWVDAETVELTNRQFGDMLRGECDRPRAEDFDYWLYVVELEPEGGHQIVRVKNPARRTAKFELRGGTWRGEAEAGGDAP